MKEWADTKVPLTSIISSNMFSITTLFSTLTIDKEFHFFSHPVHLIIVMTCARCRNFSNSQQVCSPSSFVVRRDVFRGNWGDLSHFVASTRTLDRKFHGDNLQDLAAESVMENKKKRRNEKHSCKIMFHRESNIKIEFNSSTLVCSLTRSLLLVEWSFKTRKRTNKKSKKRRL